MNPAAPRVEHPAGSWRHGTQALPAAPIRELVDRAAAVDGVAALSSHVLDALAAGTVDGLLATGSGPDFSSPGNRGSDFRSPGNRGSDFSSPGKLVGVAVAVAGDPAEVVVDPVARGNGHGSALVRAAVDRQGAVWAYGDLPAAAAVARRLGLVRGRVLLQLRRTLPADPIDARLPDGVRVRTFVPGRDEAAFLGVNARAFAWHPEQGRLDLSGLRADMARSWFDPAGFYLAVVDDPAGVEKVVGFHWTKVHEQDATPGPGARPGPVGEVYVVGVDPQAGVRGLGGPLTAIGLDHLTRRGLHMVLLYVEGDNDRALRLYERFGFRTFLSNAVYARPVADSR